MAKLKDGIMKRGRTWSYVVRVTDHETGVSKPRWVGGFATEEEAKAARDDARVKARRGEFVDRNRITVNEYLTTWLESHALVVRPNTLASYRYYLDQYVRPHIGSMRLQSVRPTTLSGLYRRLQESGGANQGPLTARTIAYVHAILRKAFNDAVRIDQLLFSNPTERAKTPRKEHRAARVMWTPRDLRAFLRSARPHRLYAFFHLAAYTGARRGELLHLRWEDVDLDGAELVIRGTLSVVDGRRVEGATKGGRERAVSLDASTVAALRTHKASQGDERRAARQAWEGDGHVFVSEVGRTLYPGSLTHMMTRLINAHNEPKDGKEKPAELLPRIRLHDLRHVHATSLLLAGVPVHVVSERLGHADPAITLQVYAHVLRKQASDTADVFRSLVEGDVDGRAEDG